MATEREKREAFYTALPTHTLQKLVASKSTVDGADEIREIAEAELHRRADEEAAALIRMFGKDATAALIRMLGEGA